MGKGNKKRNRYQKQSPEYSLSAVKNIVKNGKTYILLKRKKNREGLKLLGLDSSSALGEILKLNNNDFHKLSPLIGQSFADEYKKTINNIKAYIKFKINDDDSLVVMSFHPDE